LQPLLSLVCCVWFDNLRAEDQLLLDNQEAGIVHVCAAVVCATCDGDALLGGKPIYTVRAHLVGSDYQAHLIYFKEFLDDVGTKDSHSVLFKGVSN